MFDISMGEVLVTFGIAVALIGRRDLPKVARGAGRSLGRSVNFLQKTKDQVNSATKNAELQKMQAEINQSMKDLEEIKREVYSAGNFRQAFNPLAGNDAVMRPVEGGQQEGSPSPKSSVPHEIVPPTTETVVAPQQPGKSDSRVEQTGSSILLDVLIEEESSKRRQ